MAGHAEWQQEVIRQHNLEKPFAPENGQELKFKVGDRVVYTNDNDISFDKIITGLYKPNPIDSLYATGCRYMLDLDCYWMPIRENNLCMR